MKTKTMMSIMLMFVIALAFVVIFISDESDAETFSKDGITYSITGTNVTIKEYDQGSSTNISLSIGDTVVNGTTTYNIIGIAENAFKNKTELKSVSLGSNITSIGASSFEGCSKLESISLDSYLETIGSSAFKNCSKLASLTIPNSVTTMGADSLSGCSVLATIKFSTELGNSSSTSLGLSFYNHGSSTAISPLTINDIRGHTFTKNSSSHLEKQTVRVSFNAPQTSVKVADQYVNYGSKITTPTVKGYKILGYYESYNSTTQVFSTEWNPETNLNADKTLYLKCEKNLITSITVTTTDLYVQKGKTLEIRVTTEPSSNLYDKKLEYTVSSTQIAEFSKSTTETGKNTLTAKAPGEVTVTIKAKDGGNAQTTCKVVVYSGDNHNITVTSSGHGTASASPTSAKYGTKITLTSKPDDNYLFVKWESTAGITITNNTFTMIDSDVTVNAVFKEKPFAITITQATGGTISGPTEIDRGQDGTYSFKANSGYLLSKVIVDGQTVAEHIATYTIKNVNETHTVTAEFSVYDGASTTIDDKGDITESYTKEMDKLKINVTETFNVDGSYASTAKYTDADLNVTVDASSSKTVEGVITGTAVASINFNDNLDMSKAFASANSSLISSMNFTGLIEGTMSVDATTTGKDSTGFKLSFDASGYNGSYGLTLKGDSGTVSFDKQAFTTVTNKGKNVTFSFNETKTDDLNKIQKWLVEDYKVYEISATGNSSDVHLFKGKVTVTLPVTLKEGEKAEDAKIYVVEQFSVKAIDGEYKDGKITGEVPHLSYFFTGVNYKEPTTPMPKDDDTLVVIAFTVLIILAFLLIAIFVMNFDVDSKHLYFNINDYIPKRK